MIIIEGIDGTGKSSLADDLEKEGFHKYHLSYDEKNEQGYWSVLDKEPKRLVLDRSFISELVYGPILRNFCRINKQETKNIIEQYKKSGTKIIYLKSSKSTLLERRKSDKEDTEMLQEYFEELDYRYDKVIRCIGQYLPSQTINTSITNKEQTVRIAMKFIDNEILRE